MRGNRVKGGFIGSKGGNEVGGSLVGRIKGEEYLDSLRRGKIATINAGGARWLENGGGDHG